MNTIRKIAVVGVLGFVALVLVMSTGLAQEPGAEAPGSQASAPARSWLTGVQSSTAAAQPQGDPLSTAPDGSAAQGVGAGGAVEEQEVDATVSLRVAGSVLKPRESDVEWEAGGDGGCVYASSGNAYTWWNAPIYLPRDATVTTMRIYVDDTSASNGTGVFTVYDLYGSIHDEWGVSSSGAGGNAYFQVTIPDHVINYDLYSYVVNWHSTVVGDTVQLCGFRIYYTPPPFLGAFLPATLKNSHQ